MRNSDFYCPHCKRYAAQIVGATSTGTPRLLSREKVYSCSFCGNRWSETIVTKQQSDGVPLVQREIESNHPSWIPEACDPMFDEEGCVFCFTDHRYDHRAWCPTRTVDDQPAREAFAALAAFERGHLGRSSLDRFLNQIIQWTCPRCQLVNHRRDAICIQCDWERETQRDRGVALVRAV